MSAVSCSSNVAVLGVFSVVYFDQQTHASKTFETTKYQMSNQFLGVDQLLGVTRNR